ncbi:hypothetical protein [Halolamina sp. C58]|uniref:hypothetical protein n=1 Tax=Halolamina sp. C58 TaxID=3421640 RepID=UPI003EBA4189
MVSTFELVMSVFTVLLLVGIVLLIVPPTSIHLGLRSFERRTGASPAAVLVAIGIGLVVAALGIASATAGGGEFTVVDAFPVVLGSIGPLMVAVGLAARATNDRLTAAAAVDAGNPETGAVAVDGSLRELDGTFPVPDLDGGALTCPYALQKDRGFTYRSPVWVTVAEGERTGPLAVADETGSVRVDEDAATVRRSQLSTRSYSIDLPEGEPIPEEVESFLADSGVESPGEPSVDHRLRLGPLTPGNTVTAVGEYERVTKPGEAFWGLSGDDVLLFPGDRNTVRSRLTKRHKWLTGGGAAMTLVGVGYTAVLFLP